MALVLSGSIDISGSMTATTIIVSAPGSSGIVSSSQQIQNYNLFAQTSSANTFYGNQTITGSVRITNGLIIGASGSFASLGSYPNALTVNGNTTGTFGGAIFLARGSATQWGIISNDSDDLSITNNNSFSTRNIKIYDSAEKIEFTYSGSLADNSAGYHNIAFTGNAIVPYQTNHYDLGSETNYFRDLYISTGSIKFIDNGNVVGILSTTADGLNFDSNITIGTSSFEIGRRGTTYKNTNLVMGFDVMNDSIVTGQHNIGMGSEAGASLSSGNYNIMIGYQAGYQIGPGSRNVLIGQGSGNLLLLSSGISPDDNTLVGGNAGQFITKGNNNTALGTAALYGQIGAINTFQNNTAIGSGTATNVSGVSTNNIYIGAYAGPQSSFTTENYKFYVSNGQQYQQPYMFGNMATSSRSLDINASLSVSGSLTVSGSSLFTTKLKIGPDIGAGINSSFENALEIGSNPDVGLGGAMFFGNTLGSSTWGMLSNGSNNFAIANQSGFQSRAITLYNTENKIEFLYSGSINANGSGFHNIRFDENGIIPGQTNRYDLGSVTNVWKDLYISTGSIKVVSNGTVVSTLSTNADGSQNFPNGLTVSGSLKTSGSIKVGNYGNIKDTFDHIHLYTSGANFNNGGNIQFGAIEGSAASGVDNYISFNGSPTTAASNTSVTIWGDNSGGGAALFLNRKSSQGVESWGYTPWTIGVDLGATSTPNGLYIGTGNTFLNRSIEFNYKGLTPNILFSGSGIIPAQANTYDLGTPTKPWREIYVSTGSINFVNNGTVVSTISANADGSQNFTNGINVTGSLRVTGSLKVGDWQHGEGIANTAKLDIRTASDRGLKINGGNSSDVIITAYRGASDDMIRSMRLEGSDINIYTGDGNANTGSYIGGFNTNGLAFLAGKGIDFSGTTNGSGTTTSELLNDYEEGTWTPTFGGGGSDPTGVTYDGQNGIYTKIGRLVTVTFIMGFTTYTGGSGALYVRGLPFAATGTTGYNGAVQTEQITFSGGRTYAAIRVSGGGSVIDVQQMGGATTWTSSTIGTEITSSGTGKYIQGTITYTAS
jgi:hypothetical protein